MCLTIKTALAVLLCFSLVRGWNSNWEAKLWRPWNQWHAPALSPASHLGVSPSCCPSRREDLCNRDGASNWNYISNNLGKSDQPNLSQVFLHPGNFQEKKKKRLQQLINPTHVFSLLSVLIFWLVSDAFLVSSYSKQRIQLSWTFCDRCNMVWQIDWHFQILRINQQYSVNVN